MGQPCWWAPPCFRITPWPAPNSFLSDKTSLATIHRYRRACAEATPGRLKQRTACATALFGAKRASQSNFVRNSIWLWWVVESAGLPQPISFANASATRHAFSFSRITTTSAATPSETNFISADDSPFSMAEPSRSIAQPRIAAKLPHLSRSSASIRRRLRRITPIETSMSHWGFPRGFSSIRKPLAPIGWWSACRDIDAVPGKTVMNPPPGPSFLPGPLCLR